MVQTHSMNKLSVIFLLLFSNYLFGQESNIASEILRVECDENVNAYRLNTRLTKDTIIENTRIIHFSTTATCCVNFEIESKVTENIVKIDLKENGTECECICAYDFVVRFDSTLNSKTLFLVNNKVLKKNIPKLRLFKKRYFLFEKDTTGFDDENGLRQGFIVYVRKNDLKKVYYKDGKFIKLEITDKQGNVIITETDEDKIFDY